MDSFDSTPLTSAPRGRRFRRFVTLAACAFAALALAACDDSDSNDPGDGTSTMTDGGDDTSATGGDTGTTATGDVTASTGDTASTADGTDPGDTTDADMQMCASDRVCGSVCCDAGEFCINGGCRDSCGTGITCGPTGGLCCLANEACLADQTCGVDCAADEVACGTGSAAVCCAAGEVCDAASGACQTDCGNGLLCGSTCCAGDQQCLAPDQCAAQCANVDKLCGANDELCCGDTEVCLGDTTCVEPGDPCTLTEQCAIDEYCEPTLGACVPRSAINVCEYRPITGDFAPAPGCTWRAAADATLPTLAVQTDGGVCSEQSRVCTNNSECLAGEVCRNVGGGNLRCDCADNTQGCYGGTCRSPQYGDMSDVVMTPVVANLTDDNGDGVTDTADMPDLVFASYDYSVQGCCTNRAVLRIVPGGCNADGSMGTTYTFSEIWLDNSGGIALGNLHPASMTDETVPEIVATGRTGIFALRRTADDGTAWEIYWRNDAQPDANHTRGGAVPNIADLDGDGSPEVVVGNQIFNGQDGTLIFDGNTVGGGIGNNAFLGPAGAISDIDLDGVQEVIAGNSVYKWDGTNATEVCRFDYAIEPTVDETASICQGSLPCDGFNAVGNFDADIEGEIVIIRKGQLFVLNHDCSHVATIKVPIDDVEPYEGDGPCGGATPRSESGPPTVADFDGDGRPEIGTAGSDFYVVFDFDCLADPLPSECERTGVLWTTPNNDCSSRATASSVFDFEGDGKAEVVYADEQRFRVLDGTDGSELFVDATHSSNTRIEMPVVVDVDNDGKSEVIVAKATSSRTDEGLTVWQDADNNWVRTRRIWNQHGYHVTNVTENGQIPAQEEINWLNSRLNNYRQNVQPGGLFDAPDLTVDSFTTDTSQCATREIGIDVVIRNDGALGVPAGILVHVVVTYDNVDYDLGAFPTAEPLLPGQTTTITVPWNQPNGAASTITVTATVDDDGMGNAQYNECDENNNAVTSIPLNVCQPA